MDDLDTDRRMVFIATAVSILAHLVFFAAVIYASPLLDRPGPITSIDVSLEAFQEELPAASPDQDIETSPEIPDETLSEEPVAEPAPEPVESRPVEETVSIPDESETENAGMDKPEKPETPKPQEVKQKQPRVVRPKATKPKTIQREDPSKVREKRINKAIARIKSELENESKNKGEREIDEKSESGGGSPYQTGLDLRGKKKTADVIDVYKVEIAHSIQRNWAFPEPLAGGKFDGEAVLSFRVLPSGQIVNMRISESSGNDYLDQSALAAVKKSNPVNPHPKSLNIPYVDISLLCDTSGLK